MNTSPQPTAPTEEENQWSAKDLIAHYKQDSIVKLAIRQLDKLSGSHLHFKGLVGSSDAILAAATYETLKGTHLFILNDREEAAYFYQDLQSLLPKKNILFFPTSYKKPYQFTEIENANILQRSEVLNTVNQKGSEGDLVVTYPEALTEKVINQRSLLENTFSAKVGESLDVEFISELLTEYDFERTDFVGEAGQYAVRGGIVDVFSYANELPYRIELFGDEIESIRTFDPVTQLSQEDQEVVAIVPNVQTKLLHEVRESFFRFLPISTTFWFKDYELTRDLIHAYFKKAEEDFEAVVGETNTKVVQKPDELFQTVQVFEELLKVRTLIEFGNRFHFKAASEHEFNTKAQPSFNKDFNLLVEDFERTQSKGLTNIIVADVPRQLQRLRLIFDEINPHVEFKEMNLSLRAGFSDETVGIACYTDHQIFERYHRYQGKKRYSKSKSLTLKELKILNIGDFVTHMDYGVGRFGGLEKVTVNGKEQEAIRLIFRDDDILYASIHALHKISKYSGQEGTTPIINKLGSPEWENKKKKVKRKVKDIAKDLIKLYAKRKTAPGFAFAPDSYLQAELESSFIYEDTPDQAKATADVKEDMEQPHPMDRLVCGDVGFGKTEVAIRAAFKAVCDSKQVAVLVPTTILAMQHYKTFKERLEKLPCTVDYISRFRTTKEIKETLKNTKEGKVDILIGTHRITSKDVAFKELGLLIIDEEQKFGVKTKDKIKEFKVNVDVLTLTATPIPRTLHFSMMGARDLSVISTPPPNRQPVTTKLYSFSDEVIRDAIYEEVKRGGQAFFVHNRIEDIEHICNKIMMLVPDAKVTFAHGQMEGERLEKVMMRFIEGEYDVLVSTNIIESGLDIPNANTIIINRAHMYGLSDLHQMRGRVGRSNKKAYCYLLTPPLVTLSADSRKRLSALENFSDLGDGIKVAMRDLDIRGAGNLLGGEQSGFINDVGFDMYNKILEEAVQELKENEFKELFSKNPEEIEKAIRVDCNIESDFEILIPEDYVSNISERLNLYVRADDTKNAEELAAFENETIDRFGPLPPSVNDLFKMVRLRWKAEKLGIEKLVLKNGSMKAYLMENANAIYYQSDVFGKILTYVQKQPKKCRLQDAKKRAILQIDDIENVASAEDCLAAMLQ